MPQLWIVGGPNGAGKTTLADYWLDRTIPVISPDSIAVKSGLSPIQAGRATIQKQELLLAERKSFAIDTTLSGNRELDLMSRARRLGYKTNLIFIGIQNVSVCKGRIKERMAKGGHAVPDEDVDRRYARSMANLPEAIERADRAFILDNSGEYRRLLFMIENGRVRNLSGRLPAWALTTIPERYLKRQRGPEL